MATYGSIRYSGIEDAGIAGSGTIAYANSTDLPTSGVTTGAMAYVSASNKLYMWNGTAWFNIAIVNQAPTAITGNQATYVLSQDGTPTVVTLVSTDPEGLPLTWSSSTSGDTQVGAVTNTDNVFTITPSTNEANIGTLSVTFSVTDGNNTETSVSSFILEFVSRYWNETVLSIGTSSTNGLANSTFIDRSTNTRTVTSGGAPVQTAFHPYLDNWGVEFDGTGDYLDAPTDLKNLGTGDFTIEFWVYSRSSLQSIIIDTRVDNESATPNVGWGVFIGSGRISFANSSAPATVNVTVSDSIWPSWNHIVVLRDSGTLKIFFNGILESSTTSYTYNLSIGDDFRIGSRTNAQSGVVDLNGYLSNLRIVAGSALYTTNFTPPTEKLTAVAGTSLLTCQSNRFVDNSSNAHVITPTGNVEVSAFNPFGQESEYAVGENKGSVLLTTNKYLTTPSNTAFAVGTGDFTLEAWVYIISAPGGGVDFDLTLFGGFNFTPVFFLYIHNTNLKPTLWNGTAGATSDIAVIPKSWNHVVYSRSANTLRIFVNGEIGYEASYTTNWTSPSTVFIGKSDTNNTRYFNGYISDLKFVKGTGLYTTTFTPPTAPVGNPSASLYLPFDNAGVFDKTGNNILTPVGNASTSTTQTKYADTAMYFDGTGDGINFDDEDRAKFLHDKSVSYTIESWVYPTNITGRRVLFMTGGLSTASGVLLELNESLLKYTIYRSVSGSVTGLAGGTLPINQWSHIAVTYDKTNVRVFFNGILSDSVAWSLEASSSASPSVPSIGRDSIASTSLLDFLGYIENFQILKGVAKYTANFTPPNRTQGITYQAES